MAANRSPHCGACGKPHPTVRQRADRGEPMGDRERTCAIALQTAVSYEEAAA